VFTLEVLVDKFGDEIAPFAVNLARNLTAAFWKYSGMADGEDGEDEDDQGECGTNCYLSLVTNVSICHFQLLVIYLNRTLLDHSAGARSSSAIFVSKYFFMSLHVPAVLQLPSLHTFGIPCILTVPCSTALCCARSSTCVTKLPCCCAAAAVAAYGCLKALNTLLDGVAEMKHLLPVLEEVLFPVMAKCLSTDGQDVLEDVLELLAYFTYFGGESIWLSACASVY
jgi:hypothetical protein